MGKPYSQRTYPSVRRLPTGVNKAAVDIGAGKSSRKSYLKKSQASMNNSPNNSSRAHWELKLSSVHAIILVGLITGSMVASFYLGFLAGERTGFESGQEASTVHTARIPIPDREMVSSNEGFVSEDVYDQLAAAPKAGSAHAAEDDLPALGKIESAPAKNLADRLAPIPDAGAFNAGENEAIEAAQNLNSFTSPKIAGKADAKASADEKILSANQRLGGGGPVVGAGLGDLNIKSAPSRALAGSTLGALDEPRIFPYSGAEETLKRPAPTAVAALPQVATIPIPKVTAVATPAPKLANKSVVAPPDAESPAAVLRTILPKGWYAQVAAPRKIAEAQALAMKLKRSGFPVLIERASVRGEDYFRVVVGPEKDRVQVDRLIGQVRREGFEPFPRAVK